MMRRQKCIQRKIRRLKKVEYAKLSHHLKTEPSDYYRQRLQRPVVPFRID